MRFFALFEVCLFLHPRNKSGDIIRKLIARRMKNFNSKDIPRGLDETELKDLHFKNL